MKSQSTTEKAKKWFSTHMKPPLGVVIALCVLPAVLVALFYILRSTRSAMDWAVTYISRPVRGFLGMLSSIYPVAIMEILCTAAGIFLIYYIVKTIKSCWRRRKKWEILRKRVLTLLVAGCYIFAAWCWLWSSGYHATGFAEKNGFSREGIDVEDLMAVTEMFAEKVNELSVLMERDEEGYLLFSRREMFAQSRHIYENISEALPSLRGTVYAPKPMYLYSWLMTITEYSGMYFALTGEAMVNIQPHTYHMPMTVAHEHAHQLGIFAEDEANFVGIAACVTSDDLLFQYSGYVTGYHYLIGALGSANSGGFVVDDNGERQTFGEFNEDVYDTWLRIIDGMTDEYHMDMAQSWEFWASARTSNVGVDFIDNIITTVMDTTSDVVDAVYDNYLVSHDQELGIRSYGACVDLLVEYFRQRPQGG